MRNQNQFFLTVIGIAIILLPASSYADGWFSSGKSGVAPVTNKLYETECSACHFAYQPGLLPERSWIKMFNNLGDHFGEDASMSKENTQALLQYATSNAADKSSHKRSVKINRSIKSNDTPLRVSETKYIMQKHHELSRRHLEDNPKVKTLARCEACHTRINEGSFSEREIKIPGFGRWED